MTLRFLILMLLAASTSWAGPGPNEPPGSRKIFESSFASFTESGCRNDYPDGSGNYSMIDNDPSAPESPPKVMRYTKRANASEGGNSIICFFEPVTDIYVTYWFKTSDPFGGYPHGGNKIFGYIGQQDGNFTGAGFFSGSTPHQRRFASWWNGPKDGPWGKNCHIPQAYSPQSGECNFTFKILPNVNDPIMLEAQWHRVEMRFRLGRNATSQDGLYQTWIDKIPVHNFPNFNHAISKWNNVGITPTWDGQCKNPANYGPWNLSAWIPGYTSPNACVPWDDHYWYDNLYISTTNPGDGTQPLPVIPPPPVTPPIPPPPTKLPAPTILAPLPGATVPAGSTEVRWSQIAGASQYILNFHEEGQSYDCTMMTFCGNLPGTSKLITTKPGKKYDFWVFGIDDKGNPGESRGSSFTVQASPVTPPVIEPPPVQPPPVEPPPVEPPPVQPPPVVTPPSGPVFSNIREGVDQKGRPALSFEFQDAACPKGTRRTLKGRDTKTITIVCER